ncbi:MAG: type II secretion system secretin GspD [Pseudomonadota bacterium]|nr:type II secretion system secretin GspD [Pseudomonadota bacterium]MEC7568870.1 type II secretion system secretin GspD [Pseudomonadota bacterium]MEC8003907.1 type II secretion system secretin GspD [Pseudomonadota bacterium]MEC8007972.1 type II secretion system secretin GspD [Pseudomonadota bacterium]MED5356001.1 type II secretion system secretin GspD [Pseudomonadota bacterium]
MHAMLTNAKGFVIALVVSLLLFAKPVWGQEFTVNLKDTDIQEFIEFVADVTGTTIVIDPAVKGKVKVVSSKPVSRAELYDLFLSILDVHGYTAVRSGEVVRVIPNKNARSAPVDVISGTSVINDEYVTQVIRLDNVSAAKLIPVLRPLVPQQAHMAAYAPSNAIIISDIRANIDRIAKIIDRMDQSAVKKTEVVKLRYGVATDVVEMLKTLEKSRAGEGADANDEASLVADKRTNSVIVTADEVSIERIKGLIDYLDIPLEQSGNVRVMYLEYADATEVAEVLTRVMQNLARLDDESSGRTRAANAAKSTIEADEGTNSLIITADTDEMAALEAVIARLDIRRAQVLVEAIIVEIDVTEGRELGLQWLFANDSGLYGSNISPARQGSNAAIAQAILPEDAASTEIGVRDLAGALSQVPGTTFGWGVVDQNLTMTTILNTLEKQGNTNILSTPSLLTLDNEEAFITVGQQVPFVTGSYTNTGAANGVANPFQTIQRENVGVTLQVTPQINEGDSVVMDIVQEVSSISQQALSASDVITNERKIETKVLAKDGDIVVLGGLVKDDIQDSQQGVPLLSGIPVLGRLFRNDVVSVTKSNLLVFIRSTIIRDDDDLAGATAEKYRYIRDQQRQRRDQGLMFLDDNLIPVLPTWEDRVRSLPEVPEEQIDR